MITGLFGKTSEAKFITEIQQYNEELKLAITEDYANNMGNRPNKLNIRRSNYNDENTFTDAMKTKIPSFNIKYANKLEIKEDKLQYIGEDEQERAWLAQAISVAGILKISYVYEKGTEAAPTYEQVIPDGSYEVESPIISGYEPDHYMISGEIQRDTNVTVTYYPPSQGLEYELLSDGTYTVSGPNDYSGETLIIPREYDNKAVTQIKKDAFKNDKLIKKLIIPNSIKKVKDTAFFGSDNIEYINLNAKSIEGWAPFRIANLKELVIGENVDSIVGQAFTGCSNLTDVSVFSETVELNSVIFNSSSYLKEVKIDKNNSKYTTKDGVLYSRDGKKIYMYPPGKEGNFTIPSEVEEIGENSFHSNQYLTEIEIPETVKNVKANAFMSCNNIQYVYIDTQKLDEWRVFAIPNLRRIEIGTNVKSISGIAFYNNNNIEEVKYKGTMLQWNNVSNSNWEYTNVTQIKCLDGTVNL